MVDNYKFSLKCTTLEMHIQPPRRYIKKAAGYIIWGSGKRIWMEMHIWGIISKRAI